MKKFIIENWYKLMIGSSLFMASFGFMVHSLTPANAKGLNTEPAILNYEKVPVNADRTISVKLTDEQLNKIIPKNDDGSINIRLSEKQLKAITPPAIQDVNIQQVRGHSASINYTSNIDGVESYSLGVYDHNK